MDILMRQRNLPWVASLGGPSGRCVLDVGESRYQSTDRQHRSSVMFNLSFFSIRLGVARGCRSSSHSAVQSLVIMPMAVIRQSFRHATEHFTCRRPTTEYGHWTETCRWLLQTLVEYSNSHVWVQFHNYPVQCEGKIYSGHTQNHLLQ